MLFVIGLLRFWRARDCLLFDALLRDCVGFKRSLSEAGEKRFTFVLSCVLTAGGAGLAIWAIQAGLPF